ncbi:basic proline-rich protein-like [Ochotona princeps]|uniref:basic proline-rich protein-like n=1 Tax=Ochotona princeps TaxID=9978 RepID=UPI002714DF3A|nr:basic proline-rich protein-like [Ochotona princeps]
MPGPGPDPPPPPRSSAAGARGRLGPPPAGQGCAAGLERPALGGPRAHAPSEPRGPRGAEQAAAAPLAAAPSRLSAEGALAKRLQAPPGEKNPNETSKSSRKRKALEILGTRALRLRGHLPPPAGRPSRPAAPGHPPGLSRAAGTAAALPAGRDSPAPSFVLALARAEAAPRGRPPVLGTPEPAAQKTRTRGHGAPAAPESRRPRSCGVATRRAPAAHQAPHPGAPRAAAPGKAGRRQDAERAPRRAEARAGPRAAQGRVPEGPDPQLRPLSGARPPPPPRPEARWPRGAAPGRLCSQRSSPATRSLSPPLPKRRPLRGWGAATELPAEPEAGAHRARAPGAAEPAPYETGQRNGAAAARAPRRRRRLEPAPSGAARKPAAQRGRPRAPHTNQLVPLGPAQPARSLAAPPWAPGRSCRSLGVNRPRHRRARGQPAANQAAAGRLPGPVAPNSSRATAQLLCAPRCGAGAGRGRARARALPESGALTVPPRAHAPPDAAHAWFLFYGDASGRWRERAELPSQRPRGGPGCSPGAGFWAAAAPRPRGPPRAERLAGTAVAVKTRVAFPHAALLHARATGRASRSAGRAARSADGLRTVAHKRVSAPPRRRAVQVQPGRRRGPDFYSPS